MSDFTTLADYFIFHCLKHATKPAYVIRRRIKKETIFYGEIPGFLYQLNTFFNKYSVKKPILIWAPNCPEYSLTLITGFSTQRTVVPVDYRTSIETLKKIITDVKPGLIITSKFLAHSLLPQDIPAFFVEELLPTIKKLKKTKINPINNPTHISEIIYTSGTTGTPKGVILTESNFLHELKMLKPRLPNLKKARVVSLLPLSHIYEQLTGLFLPFQDGATVFYATRLNSYRVLEAFKEYRPTHQTFVPQMLRLFLTKIEEKAAAQGKLNTFRTLLKVCQPLPRILRKYIFSEVHKHFGGKLKIIVSGGAPLDYELAKKWHTLGFTVIQGYGATETTGVVSVTTANDSPPQSVGKPLDGVTVMTKENELLVSGPNISPGYYRKPEVTHTKFIGASYLTGDIGSIDDEGRLHLKGRDAFKIVLENGEKVYVEDIEKIAITHPNVQDVCVVAKKKNDADVIHCILILKKQADNSLEEIISWLNSRLESKQQISYFSLWPDEDFPRTSTLKIDRKIVADYINQKEVASPSSKTTQSEIKDVIDILSQLSYRPKQSIAQGQTLASDLKLDSLARLELSSLIEEYLGIVINEAEINQHTTVEDLEILVKNASQKIEQPYFPTWHFTKWGMFLRKCIVKGVLSPLYARIITIEYPQSNLPLIPPGAIVIFNHPGIMDGACVVQTLLNQGQFRYFTNAHDELWFPKKWIATFNEIGAGAIPIYKSGHRLQKTLQLNADLLAEGFNLLYAPQGTQQRQEQEDPFQPGIGYLVKELDTPVVIVKIKGYRDVWPAPATDIKDSTLQSLLPKKRGTVQVYISQPIKKDWSNFSSSQITSLLEKKYKRLEKDV